MYYRIYPSRNNTIFRYRKLNTDQTFTYISEEVNAGANPTMELMDGAGESKLVFQFDIPLYIREKLVLNPYTTRFNLFDAGTLFEPALGPAVIDLLLFEQEFAEGDGYSFLKPDSKVGISNWNFASPNVGWNNMNVISSTLTSTANDDISIPVSFPDIDVPTVYLAVGLNNSTYDASVKTKFFYSRHTKTVFKPYLEFFINDTIKDKSSSCYGGSEPNSIYLVNQTGKAFSGEITAVVTYESGLQDSPIVSTRPGGIYSIDITPPAANKKTYTAIEWKVDGVGLQKQTIEVKSPNQLSEEIDYQNLMFYPITPSTHNIIRQGDILPFSVVSQIRGSGNVVNTNYEYRVTSADGFEMVPWQPVSVYRTKMFFNLYTEFFFPEQQYEVWIRNNTQNFSITSNTTYKFKLAMNDKSHLRNQSASPYYSRWQQFNK